jgi:hypothetical protein
MVVTGCVSLSPEGARVFVYRAPLDVSGEDHAMPGGCERLSATPQTVMTEEEMEGTDDPYRVERNEAGAAGANALLVLSQQVIPRRDTECSTASPITDCPGSSGAWFHVEFESYSCTPDAMQALDHVPHSSAATHAGAVGR